MTRALVRTLAGTAVAGGVLLIGLAAVTRLPDPMATHFGLDLNADGASPLWLGLLVCPVVASAPIFASALPGRTVRPVTIAFFASLGVLLQLALVHVNEGVRAWPEASMPVWLLAAVLLPPFAIAWALGRSDRAAAGPDQVEALDTLDLAADERAIWTGSARNRFVLLEGAAGLTLGLALQQPLLVVAVLAVLPFWRLQVHAGQAGVALSLGAPVVLRRRYALDTITSASAGSYDAFAWGYRGSRKAFRSAVWAIRRGPCLVLRMTDGTTLQITVDDPERAAALLNGLLVRA